jgi:hypothetical protein
MRRQRLPLLLALLAVLLIGASRADAATTVTNTDHDLSYGRLLFKDLSVGTNAIVWSSWRFESAPGTPSSVQETIQIYKSLSDRCSPNLQGERSSGTAYPLGSLNVLGSSFFVSPESSVPLGGAPPAGRNLTICWYVAAEGKPSRLILSSLIDYRGLYAPTIKSSDPDPAFGRLILGYPVFDRTRVDWTNMQFAPAAGVSVPAQNQVQAIEHFGSGACAADPAAALKLPNAAARFEHHVHTGAWTYGNFTASIEAPPLRSEEATLCWYLHENGRAKLVMRSDLKF